MCSPDGFEPRHRLEAGDLIVGTDQHSAIGALVERTTRTVRPLHLPHRDGDTLHQALRPHGRPARDAAAMDHLGPGNRDGPHLTITGSLGAPIYFCDARSPWQRGSNENINGSRDRR
jgi:transposase, IS30 family